MIARFSLVALDSSDPHMLAEFYSAVTGWAIEPVEEDDWVQLDSGGGPTLAFQRADGHQPPDWPAGPRPQQLHLDFDVPDLDEGEERVLALGARKAGEQPKPQYWRVFLDPAGHPFCLVLEPERREQLVAQEAPR